MGQYCNSVNKSGFSRFPDQPDPEIRKFLQIQNGLAKTVNLIYYLQKAKKSGFSSVFFPFSGSTGSGNPEICPDSERACQDG